MASTLRNRSVVFFAILLLLALPLLAQTGTSTIRGTVTDAQGRVITGAAVTITSLATNAARSMKTTDAGTYNFDFITPGDYRLEVESQGFKKQTISELHALIGKTVEQNLTLEVGATSEVVEVRAAAAGFLVNTQDASLGNNFVTEQIAQLPIEGRSITDLLSLQPGVTREGYVAGARADQSNVTLDGVDINNAQTANSDIPRVTNSLVIGGLDTSLTTGPVLRLNSEAIEEFRVTTANANANQGRSSGSQVNLVTKSGSNTWHASGFEAYRTKGFTANDWFNNHSGVGRQNLVRHTFGGGIGGPIVKNRAFFFYSYEGKRDAASETVSRIVPKFYPTGGTLADGVVRYAYCVDVDCTSTQVASLTLTPANPGPYAVAGINQNVLDLFQNVIAKYPSNDPSIGDGLNTEGFRFNAPTPVKLNSHIAKFDFNLTNSQTAFVRFNVIHDHQTLAQWLPDTVSPKTWNHPRGIAVGHVWTKGNWVNNFRYGMTRQAFTTSGDSNNTDFTFRFVFQPDAHTHSLQRVTPVHNITDDISWIHGNHTLQFGTNVRITNNRRITYAGAFDFATTNPSWYASAGDHVSADFQTYLDNNGLPGDENVGQSLSSTAEAQNAVTSIIGRLNEYTANYTFVKDGSLTPVGTPTQRDFATQAYDFYVQDAWKVRPNLTLTLGLRYSLERPVYETKGYEVRPTVPLGTYFAERLAAAQQGQNLLDPIVLALGGPANNGKPMYNWDKNNFQPRVGFAWSPAGANGKSVIRAGFGLTNDYYGQALAVDFDLNNTLGFVQSGNISPNFYDTRAAADLGPLFTDFGMSIRTLPNQTPTIPNQLSFPIQQPIDFGERIEQSVDSNLRAPTEYVWNLTFERQMPKGLLVSASYIGRKAQHLLARRDVAAFNNTRDPKSGMDWYTAATVLEKQRQQGVDTSQIATIPYFENLFPAGMADLMNNVFGLDPGCPAGDPNAGFDPAWTNTQLFYAMQSRTPTNPCAFFSGNDWTDTQALIDQVLFFTDAGPTRFMGPQYGALSAWSTIANSNYNAFTFSARERLKSLTLDFNYTFSHSLDDASGIQGETAYAGSAFITNPIRQADNYATSDFDVKHNINASAVWQLPFGKGRTFMNGGGAADAIMGGWQLAGIFRWNTGLPQTAPFDDARWATNWNVQSNVTPTSPIHTCADRPTTAGSQPKLFGHGCDIVAIYQSFRNAYPGETGPRNIFRLPGYVDLDLGVGKTWKMPWSEGHALQLRWDIFNVTNTQPFGAINGGSRTGWGVVRDPALRNKQPSADWSNFIQIQGSPRVMQVALRYSF